MKKTAFINLGFMLASMMLVWSSCKTTEGDIQELYDHVEAVSHTWTLTDIEQQDNVASPVKVLNVNSYKLGTNAASLNISADKTFTCNTNDSKVPFPATGTWRFDDETYPAAIYFKNTAGAEIKLKLLNSVRPFDKKMNLGLSHNDGNQFIVKHVFVRS